MRPSILIIIAVLALGNQAHALDLTVDECVALGLEKNHTLKAQQTLVESAYQDKQISRSEYLPTLTAQGNYTVLDKPERVVIEQDTFGPGMPSDDTDIRNKSHLYGAGVTLRQTLYAGGRITHAGQRDDELLIAAQHAFGSQQTQLVYDLKRTFYEILIHRHYIDSYAQQVTARQEGLRNTKALVEEGQLSDDKIDHARARLMFSEAGLMETEQRTANALDRLRRLLALDNSDQLQLIEDKTYPVLKNSLPDLNTVALQHREDLKQLDAQIEAAAESLKVAKSRYQPEIYAQGSYQRQRETNLTRADTWMASLNFDWPLFEGGRTDAQVIKAKAEQQRLKDLRHDLVATIHNDVLAGQRLVEQKQLLVEAYRVNLQAEERIYRDIQGRQALGEVTEVDQAEQKAELLMAQANYQETINQLRIAVASLEATLAAPVDDLLVTKDIYSPQITQANHKPLQEAEQTSGLTMGGTLTSSAVPSGNNQPALSENSTHYAIQLGAFKSEARAVAFRSSLEDQYPGIKFDTIFVKGFHKVRSMPLDSHAAAVSELEKLNGKGFIIRANENH